jgi:hypothetical protein
MTDDLSPQPMDLMIRLLVRFILVPLGATIAAVVAAVFVAVGHWNAVFYGAHPNRPPESYLVEAVFFVEVVGFLMLSLFAFYTYLVAAIGVLISEAFAIRSWLFHAANGALSTWIALTVTQDIIRNSPFLVEPLIVVAAGLAAGLVYWIIAGWTAGFWKPIPRQPAVW